MSGLTGYTVAGGQDLSGIFQPYTVGDTQASLTNYTISTGDDLSDIFAVLTGTPISYDTGFKANNPPYSNTDLRYIFAAYLPLPFSVTSGTYSYIYSNNYYTISFLNNASATINFLTNLNNVNVVMVGGGGGGSGTPLPTSTYKYYGAGGGGGGQAILKYDVTISSYSLSVGTAGTGNDTADGTSGTSTTFDIHTCSGGQGGKFGSNSTNSYSNTTIPNLGGIGGNGPAISGSEVIYSGTGGDGGAGGAGGVNPFLVGSTPFSGSSPSLNWAQLGFDSYLKTNSNTLALPTNILNYSGGGAGSASYVGAGGNGSGGVPSTTPLVTANGQVAGAGGGGTNYNNLNTAGNGLDGACIVYFQYPQIIPPLLYTGIGSKYNYIFDGSYCYVNFITGGTLSLSSSITTAIIVVVAGGGGGGGGNNGVTNSAGAGGGGGGAAVISGVSLNTGTYNIVVGAQGVGGIGGGATGINGTSGGTSSFGGTILSSTGGGGGGFNASSTVAAGGGTQGTSIATGYTIINSNGGGVLVGELLHNSIWDILERIVQFMVLIQIQDINYQMVKKYIFQVEVVVDRVV
jgi:hypothetical protein